MPRVFFLFFSYLLLINGLFSQNFVIFDTTQVAGLGIDNSPFIDKKFDRIKNDNLENIYVSMNGKGIFKYVNNTWLPFKDIEFEFQVNSFDIEDYLLDNNNELWAIASLGLHYFNESSGIVKTYSRQNSPLIFSGLPFTTMTQDSGGNIWIYNSGIFSFNRTNKWKYYNVFSGINSNMNYQDNKLFLSSNTGATIFDIALETSTKFDTSNTSLSSDYIISFRQDAFGNYWIATLGAGLAKLSPNNNLQSYNTSNSGIASDSINDMIIASDGNIWVATKNGLSKFDGTNWTTYNNNNSDLPSDNVNYLHTDFSGNLWMSCNYHVAKLENAISSINKIVDNNMITIYPTPSSDKINISFHDNNFIGANINIYDSVGKLVKSINQINEHIITTEISDFAKGIYHLKIETKQSLYTKKFLVH